MSPFLSAMTMNRHPASDVVWTRSFRRAGAHCPDHGSVGLGVFLGILGSRRSLGTLSAARNALLQEITHQFPYERLVLLEDTVELQCAARDHLALRTNGRVTLADLVRNTLRTSPDRIIVGEVRGAEALDLLDAWATGHPGGIATVHASSPEGALLRLDRLAQRANVPPQAALVAEAVGLVVVIEGGNARRRVADIARVDGLGLDGRYQLTHSREAAA